MGHPQPRIDVPGLRLRSIVQYADQTDEEYLSNPFRWFPYSSKMQFEEIAPGVRRAPIIYGEFTQKGE